MIAIQVVAVGTLDSLLVHPREVFKTTILANTTHIVFMLTIVCRPLASAEEIIKLKE
ncbi:JAB domain-containing protein [Cohnella faecalis]|uniref:RadC-like JAB domain-containing protein n=1 Tax=Cohnella faecalis TaxID=2315694 RepID=A0A398CFU9_9BACL|nr:hypothetical protein D3H35_24930 [Cohnella faecalis]